MKIKKLIPKRITSSWIPASKTRNFALNDPLLDYLKMYNITSIEDKPRKIKKLIKIKNKVLKKRKRKKKILTDVNTFMDYILLNGLIFEDKIYNQLVEKYNTDIVKICESYQSRDIKYYNKTIEELKKGTKIIYQGVLCDFDNEVFGVPDLIVRSDILNSLFDDVVISRIEQQKPATLINANNYHYRIIDIKNSILHLNVDNRTIRNNINIKPFKTQINIYNECLGKVQGYKPSEAYILGRGWFTESRINNRTIKQSSNNPFNKPGIIEINKFDEQYKIISIDAINWLKDLNNNNKKWKLNPPSNRLLYPNMNNNMDGQYRKVKNQISNNIGEITNIWNCSISNRTNAFDNNIYSWRNKDCNSEILGIKGKRAKIIDTIINFHRDPNKKIKLDATISNKNNWQDSSKLSFYVDFETLNGELNNNNNIIFMIGLGWEINNKWNYKNYTIKNLSNEEEKKNIQLFLTDIKNISEQNNIINPNIFHWSPAERIIFDKMNKKYNNEFLEPNWFDFLDIFKENLILIKNCYNFSLKSIAREMYNNKYISTIWDNDVCDGLDAMFLAWKEYNNNDDINNNDNINKIIKYNEIDCKVIWEIVNYIRNNLNK